VTGKTRRTYGRSKKALTYFLSNAEKKSNKRGKARIFPKNDTARIWEKKQGFRAPGGKKEKIRVTCEFDSGVEKTIVI